MEVPFENGVELQSGSQGRTIARFHPGSLRPARYCAAMEWAFEGEIIEWRGPAPFFFAAMPPDDSADLKEAARALIYWGQVPALVVIGETEFFTALFPREGRYLVPIKDAVRVAEGLDVGDVVAVVVRPMRREDAQ